MSLPSTTTRASAGHVIVRGLAAHGIDRVFVVPGESYLEVLDGLHDAPIETIVCRHEGGAAYLAEAYAKLTGRPGVAMVTRGPGAANAMIAIHQAYQDSTPLVLFVGLVPVADRDRESFQEFDIRAWFGSSTKQVFVVEDPDAAARTVAKALHVAASGRPGPVVVGLPEELLRVETEVVDHEVLPVSPGSVTEADRAAVRELIEGAQRPVAVVGRNAWSPQAAARFTAWCESIGLPVLVDWSSPDVLPTDSPVFAGSLGYGRADSAAQALADSDALLLVGTVLGDVSSDGFTLRQGDDAATVVVSPDPALLGHSGPTGRHIVCHVDTFAQHLPQVADSPVREAWRAQLRAAHEAYAQLPDIDTDTDSDTDASESPASMTAVMAALLPRLPRDTVLTSGAGNHIAWAARFLPNLQYPGRIGTRNGSMGYSIPSAVAACLAFPDRFVLTVAGDGEFMMNASELATAVQYGAAPLVLVMDNGQYGTIRAHQEQFHPGRVSGTQLRNPDFAALVEALGGVGARVEKNADIEGALDAVFAAVQEGRPGLVHVIVDPAVLLP